jgi:hypothetical protein
MVNPIVSSNTHGDPVSATGSAANDPELLKRRELARAINVSPRTVDNWQKQKKIPVIKLSPRCCRFDLQSVLRALRRFEIKEAN